MQVVPSGLGEMILNDSVCACQGVCGPSVTSCAARCVENSVCCLCLGVVSAPFYLAENHTIKTEDSDVFSQKPGLALIICNTWVKLLTSSPTSLFHYLQNGQL